jgi:hypothetical protein
MEARGDGYTFAPWRDLPAVAQREIIDNLSEEDKINSYELFRDNYPNLRNNAIKNTGKTPKFEGPEESPLARLPALAQREIIENLSDKDKINSYELFRDNYPNLIKDTCKSMLNSDDGRRRERACRSKQCQQDNVFVNKCQEWFRPWAYESEYRLKRMKFTKEWLLSPHVPRYDDELQDELYLEHPIVDYLGFDTSKSNNLEYAFLAICTAYPNPLDKLDNFISLILDQLEGALGEYIVSTTTKVISFYLTMLTIPGKSKREWYEYTQETFTQHITWLYFQVIPQLKARENNP